MDAIIKVFFKMISIYVFRNIHQPRSPWYEETTKYLIHDVRCFYQPCDTHMLPICIELWNTENKIFLSIFDFIVQHFSISDNITVFCIYKCVPFVEFEHLLAYWYFHYVHAPSKYVCFGLGICCNLYFKLMKAFCVIFDRLQYLIHHYM